MVTAKQMTSLRPLLVLTLTLFGCGARSHSPADLGIDDAGEDGALADGGGGCATDSECTVGSEWCVEGACVPCDNSALDCDLACENGWELYERNGCHPCACAPTNACRSDSECGSDATCAAGAFCWCSGDPACCQGNVCVPNACDPPPPVGCVVRGCPVGEVCDRFAGCAPSGCGCETSSGTWLCTADCSGGTCQPAP